MTTTNINPAYAHLSEAEVAENQRLLNEAKELQAHPGGVLWVTDVAFHDEDGILESSSEAHCTSLTAAMREYEWADKRGHRASVSLLIQKMGREHKVLSTSGKPVVPVWVEVLIADTSLAERVEARKARA